MDIKRSGSQPSSQGPAEKHWHGAAPTTAMTHIAIVEQLDGKAVEWMEKVSDEEYAAATPLHSREAR
jgi:hypothetical protein